MTEDELKEFAELCKQGSQGFDVVLLQLPSDSLTYARLDGMSGILYFIYEVLIGKRPFSEIKEIIMTMKAAREAEQTQTTPRNTKLN